MSEDERHLPGYVLEGYDADTQQYTWRIPQGEHVQSAPGTRYSLSMNELDFESEQAMIREDKKAYRYFLPFLVLVGLFLFVLISPLWRRASFEDVIKCEAGIIKHDIRSGETCYESAEKYDITIDRLKEMNNGLRCENLEIGQGICVARKVVS